MIEDRVFSVVVWLSKLSSLATVCFLLIWLSSLALGGYLFSFSRAIKFLLSIVELCNDGSLLYMPAQLPRIASRIAVSMAFPKLHDVARG
jgi:hypothetical protein